MALAPTSDPLLCPGSVTTTPGLWSRGPRGSPISGTRHPASQLHPVHTHPCTQLLGPLQQAVGRTSGSHSGAAGLVTMRSSQGRLRCWKQKVRLRSAQGSGGDLGSSGAALQRCGSSWVSRF